jgi:triacylglycerol lipase
LYVLDNAAKYPENRPTVYTFASPRVGDARFVSSFDALALTSYRLANVPDLVPYLPPEILGFGHVAELQQIDSTWSARWTLSCAHALNTYLHVLDPSAVPLAASCKPLFGVEAAASAELATASGTTPQRA